MKDEFKFLGQLFVIDGVSYVDYNFLMEREGLSKHFHHMERRKKKYPKHIKEHEGKIYMSLVLAKVLSKYHKSHKELISLQD